MDELKTLEQVEADHIEAVLKYCQSNKSMAARILNITTNTLCKKIDYIERNKIDAKKVMNENLKEFEKKRNEYYEAFAKLKSVIK